MCGVVRGIVRILVLFLLLGQLTDAALAAPPMVVPGEYLIKPKSAAAGFTFSKKSLGGNLNVKKSLGAHLVVTANNSVSMHANTFVPLDPADRTCKDLLASGTVESCEPNYKLEALAVPNDPSYSRLWGLSASKGIDAPKAWDRSTGSQEVVVAVIDTGIDYTHSDLTANVWTNAHEIPRNGVDDDNNGYVDDVHGIDTLAHSGDPMDDNGHGTHVSGTIGATGNNGVGVAGINWNVKIMGLKFLGSSGSGAVSGAIEALRYAVAMKRRGVNVRVSNNSWGGGSYSEALKVAITDTKEAGIIFVAAAGNEGTNNDSSPSYPANYDLSNVISVAALDSDKTLASFSNYGASKVDIAAPGVNILSTVAGGGYASYSGTSMATPHVVGAVALLLGSEPTLSMHDAIMRLYDTAVPLSTLTRVVRTGRALNVGRMLANESAPLPQTPAEAPPCVFTASAAGSEPDLSADNAAPVVEGADEGYASVSLPFKFPIDGKNAESVTVSPNGILYFGYTPDRLDYQSGDQAPLYSVAALHADLVSTVRASITSEAAVFSWRSIVYGNPAAGSATMRVKLYPSGAIEEWLTLESDTLASIVQANALIGLTGKSTAAGAVFAKGGSSIQNGLAIRYTAQCAPAPSPVVTPAPVVHVREVRLWGLKRSGRRMVDTKQIEPGGRFKIRVSADGSASSDLGFALDNTRCPESFPASVKAGRVYLRGYLPRKLGRLFGKLTVSIQQRQSTRRIARESKVRRRSVTADQIELICHQLAGSVKKYTTK